MTVINLNVKVDWALCFGLYESEKTISEYCLSIINYNCI